jgi:DnaJ-class molecular chaperone
VTSTHSDEQSTRTPIATDDEIDYYQLLGVPYTATRADITRAYREAMKRSHPDRRHPTERAAAEEHAKLLNRAFTTLSRTDSRRTYDSTIKARVVQDQIMSQYFGGFGMPGSADPYGDRHRRPPTPAERQDQKRNDRNAMFSVVIVFAGATIAVVALLILWAVVDAVFGRLF